jgi:small conductance mechanosensitive channel
MDNITESTDKMTEYMDMAYKMAIEYGPKFILAILTLIIGLWVIKRFVNSTKSHFVSKADPTLGSFIGSLLSAVLKGVLLIAVASMIGIETTSFIAVLGAAGLAIGLALQGSLANFAGGVLILMFKPFKVGDLIEAQGHIGTVKDIQIFNTLLSTGDNRRVIIPNGALSNSSMVNINQEQTRRVDLSFGIGYGDDIDKAKSILQRLADEDSRVLKDPAAMIVLAELADSSVNFKVRLWVNTADYWGVYFCMHEAVKKAFDNEGISIPFPQQDVHMHTV